MISTRSDEAEALARMAEVQVLLARVARQVSDARVLKLIRSFADCSSERAAADAEGV